MYDVIGNDPKAIRQVAEKYGFCHVRGLFSKGEIEALEVAALDAKRQHTGALPDLYSLPAVRWPMLDDRVLGIAHELLGEKLVYYRETNMAIELERGALTAKPFDRFHCDARGSKHNLHGACEENANDVYPAYRFGIYFRNYREASGGLKVAPGSHKFNTVVMNKYAEAKAVASSRIADYWVGGQSIGIPTPPFDLYNVPSEPGDIVIFNLKTFHSAGALRLKDRPQLAVLPLVERQIVEQVGRDHDLLVPIPEGTRNAIFFDYGKSSPALDFYIKWRAVNDKVAAFPNPEFYQSPSDQIIFRDDKAIVRVVKKIRAELAVLGASHSSLADVSKTSGVISAYIDELIGLCARHQEFAPEYALFDRAAFAQKVASDKVGAATLVIDGVIALLAASAQDMKR